MLQNLKMKIKESKSSLSGFAVLNLSEKSLFLLIILFPFWIASCSSEPSSDSNLENNENYVRIVTPNNGQYYSFGDSITVELQFKGNTKADFYLNNSLHTLQLSQNENSITISSRDLKSLGKNTLHIEYTSSENVVKRDNRTFYVYSDVVPKQLKVKIVEIYPHDKTSYTQGLEFYKNRLFESTGRKGYSILAEANLYSGDIIRKRDLAADIFGEGITILNDTIYQITYKAGICYTYDIGFNYISSFNYDGEGWGLCNDFDHLIMSNGSNQVVWRNPNDFSIKKSLEVYDNNGLVENLNELELMRGDLYANIYTENRIAQIDTSTGKVISYIDCSLLALDAKEYGNDVLNGIAFNPVTQKIYMTGKLWSKLYEVVFENEVANPEISSNKNHSDENKHI